MVAFCPERRGELMMTNTHHRPRFSVEQQLALLACVGISAFIVLFVAQHVVQAGAEPQRQAIGQLIHGTDGWLFSASMVALGLGSAALTIALAKRGQGNRRRWRWGVALLGAWSCCCFTVAIAPAQPRSVRATSLTGLTHGVALATGFVILLLGSVTLIRSLGDGGRGNRWQLVRWLTMCEVIVLGLLLVSWLGSIADSQVGSPTATWFALTERLLVGADASLLLALAAIAWHPAKSVRPTATDK